MESGGINLYELLARRSDVLVELQDGHRTKPDLVDTLGVSRSTIDRAIRELETAELVTRRDGLITLTTRGGMVLDLHEFCMDIADNLAATSTALANIPPENRPHFALFADATIVSATGAASHRPVTALESLLEDTNRVRALSMTVIPTLVEFVREHVLAGNLEIEMVVSDAVLSRLVSTHSEALDETVNRNTVSLYRTDTNLPYGVSILESDDTQRAVLLLHGDGGISTLVHSDSPMAVSWAESVIAHERSQAEPV